MKVQTAIDGVLPLGGQWRVIPYSTRRISLLVYNDLGERILSEEISEACQLCLLRVGRNARLLCCCETRGTGSDNGMHLIAPGEICVIVK